MRVALLALGPTATVRPFIALGLALQGRGHTVRLLAAADHEPVAYDHGLPYAVVGEGEGSPLADDPGAAVARLPELAGEALLGCTGAELIVADPLGVMLAVQVAERLGAPCIPVHFDPNDEPDLVAGEAPTWLPLRDVYSGVARTLARRRRWEQLREPLNGTRATLGLPDLSAAELWRRARRAPPLTLFAYSEALAPRPRAWPPTYQITGFWRLEAPVTYKPPASLTHFLAAGDPPVYVALTDAATLVSEALAQVAQRGLLFNPTAPALPEHLLSVSETPLPWLLPKVAGMVCDGNAEAVALALAAGKPVVTVTEGEDPGFWSRQVAALGAGPPPLPRTELTVERLAAALAAVGTPEISSRAETLGTHICAEDGAARAVAALESLTPAS